jgi:hypothetical protein
MTPVFCLPEYVYQNTLLSAIGLTFTEHQGVSVIPVSNINPKTDGGTLTDVFEEPGSAPAAMDRAMLRQMLIENPDWVRGDTELLSHLAGAPEGVADLGRVVRDRLLGEVRQLKQREKAIAHAARENLALMARAQGFVLSLINCADMDELDYTLAWEAPAALGVDCVRLYLEGATPMIVSEAIHACAGGLTNELLGDDNDFTGLCPSRTARTLYGAEMGSHALCRLEIGGQTGLLALAAREPDIFHTGQGTEILNFVARAVEQRLSLWLTTD